MTRLTMKVAGTSKIAAVASGVMTPKKPTKLIATKTARTTRAISIARIKATSRTSVTEARRADPFAEFRTPVFRALAP